jgi:hypothetical protein
MDLMVSGKGIGLKLFAGCHAAFAFCIAMSTGWNPQVFNALVYGLVRTGIMRK